MEKLSNKIADYLLEGKYIDKKMYEVYQYGLQMALEISMSFVTSILICCFMRKIVEGILFFVIFIPLRSFLGGIHMKNFIQCYILSCITLIAVLFLSSFAPEYYVSWGIIGISLVVIFCEARKEKMRDKEGKRFYHIICVLLFIDFILCGVLYYLSDDTKLFLVACTNLLVAISKFGNRVYDHYQEAK